MSQKMELANMQKDIIQLKEEVKEIKALIKEPYELNDETLEAIKKARAAPDSDYVDIDEL